MPSVKIAQVSTYTVKALKHVFTNKIVLQKTNVIYQFSLKDYVSIDKKNQHILVIT